MKDKTIGIIGLGYVGLPLAIEFAKAGINVIGIDLDDSRIKQVNMGKSYIKDVKDKDLKRAVKIKKLKASNNYDLLKYASAIIICVPTPLSKNEKPDLSAVEEAGNNIAKILQKGQLIVLESTSYPGTTREVLLPRLEASGLKAGKDFNLAFSPERIDPGNKKFTIKNVPKVVGGLTRECTARTKKLYSKIISYVYPVSSPEVAEAEKLLENIFRSVNIALVNETAMLYKKMGIDIWEVIEAARTKPYGFMTFYPGPGIGGHCIPADPFYLAWKAKRYGFDTKFIRLAGKINNSMPAYVVELIRKSLSRRKKSLKAAKILALGAAYKKDIPDLRDSPALKVMDLLRKKGARVTYNDPYVPKFKQNGKTFISKKLTNSLLKNADCVVILTDHSAYNYDRIARNARLVVDTRNATKRVKNRSNIITL